MSWQQYIDTLEKSGHVHKAAIYGHNGALWASSGGFNPSNAEITKLVGGFNDVGPLRSEGLFVHGTKYLVLRGDDQVIYGKQGQGGVSVYKTKQAIIIAVYVDKQQPGQCNNAVEKVGKYLTDNGY